MTSAEVQKLADNASPSIRAALLAAINPAPKPAPEAPAGKAGIRIPKARKKSSAEAQYEARLRREFPDCEVRHEPFGLRLASGARYTPDFVVLRGPEIVLMVEVKGSYRLHSAGRSHLAFKTAISEWPALRWRYAAKGRDGAWDITDVEPPITNTPTTCQP